MKTDVLSEFGGEDLGEVIKKAPPQHLPRLSILNGYLEVFSLHS